MFLRTLLLTALALACLAQPATASVRKSDIITLYNGDRVTGEIKSLRTGAVELSTDALGTLKVEWQEVAHVQSRYNYEVRTSNGARYYGTLQPTELPGELLINDARGDQHISALEVVEMRPIEKDLKERFDIYMSAGYSYTKATDSKSNTVNLDLTYNDEDTWNSLTARHTLSSTNEEQSRSGRAEVTRGVWSKRGDYYRTLNGSVETNDQLGLQHRYTVGAGLGRYFIESHQFSLTGQLGVQALTEQDNMGGESESVEATLSTELALWRMSEPEVDVKWNLSLYPSLTESGRTRGTTDLRVSWEIIHDLFFDVTGFGTYDNDSASAEEFDWGISTGIGWKY